MGVGNLVTSARAGRSVALLVSLFWLQAATAGSPPDSESTGPKRTAQPAWLTHGNDRFIATEISPPPDFSRASVPSDSFGAWLRRLPLKPAGSPVFLYNGQRKARQDVHAAVLDMDVGAEDLQQCADAYMRLVAEYLWSRDRSTEVRFLTANGSWLAWSQWKKGARRVGGKWVTLEPPADDRGAFREFLNEVYRYANTESLERQTEPVGKPGSPRIGDLYLQPANRRRFGHAVVVVDLAANASGEQVMLLAQSYMPAQEIHLLVNFEEPEISPWYRPSTDGALQTPEWRFPPESLRRLVLEGAD